MKIEQERAVSSLVGFCSTGGGVVSVCVLFVDILRKFLGMLFFPAAEAEACVRTRIFVPG